MQNPNDEAMIYFIHILPRGFWCRDQSHEGSGGAKGVVSGFHPKNCLYNYISNSQTEIHLARQRHASIYFPVHHPEKKWHHFRSNLVRPGCYWEEGHRTSCNTMQVSSAWGNSRGPKGPWRASSPVRCQGSARLCGWTSSQTWARAVRAGRAPQGSRVFRELAYVRKNDAIYWCYILDIILINIHYHLGLKYWEWWHCFGYTSIFVLSTSAGASAECSQSSVDSLGEA